jgi:hypothetical protein
MVSTGGQWHPLPRREIAMDGKKGRKSVEIAPIGSLCFDAEFKNN